MRLSLRTNRGMSMSEFFMLDKINSDSSVVLLDDRNVIGYKLIEQDVR